MPVYKVWILVEEYDEEEDEYRTCTELDFSVLFDDEEEAKQYANSLEPKKEKDNG